MAVSKIQIGAITRSAVVLLIAGLGFAFFVENFEKVEYQSIPRYSSEARRNQFLALERLLSHWEMEVQSVPGRDLLLDPPDEVGVMVVANFGPNLPDGREQALVDWIARGGHFVIRATEYWDEDTETSGNHFIDGLGAQLHAGEDYEDDIVTAELDTTEGSISVGFRTSAYLLDASAEAVYALPAADAGYHVLSYERGQGSVTVISDIGFLSNYGIDENDNVLYALALTGGRPAQPVWLLFDTNMPSLWTLLAKHGATALISVAVFVLTYLWYLTCRAGPILSPPDRVRRDLMEHMDATANYCWRLDRAAGLFKRSQLMLEESWRRKHFQLSKMDPGSRAEWIAARTGRSQAEVADALYAVADDDLAIINASRVQQDLTQELQSGGM
jgi:hypothetical protein